MTTPIDQMLSGLRGVRRNGDGWQACCPGHDDHTPSLSIAMADDGTILFKCFAGCEQAHVIERVCATAGIDRRELFPPPVGALHGNGREPSASGNGTMRRLPAPWPGLTVAQYAAAKQLDPTWLGTCGLADIRYVGKPAVRISYFDAAGNEAAVRFRVAMEKGDGWDRFKWLKGAKVCLYGQDRLGLAKKRGYAVLPEGESDTHTLWLYDEPAMGIPGVDTWKESRDAPLLADIPIIYVPIEPDQGGRRCASALPAP
jgi:putative DNA primase/helicase